MKKTIILPALFGFISMSYGQTFTASFNTTIGGKALTLNVDVDKTKNKVTITESGPSTIYFGFGFNAAKMTNTYAIVSNSTGVIVEERKLAHDAAGTVLTPSTTLVSNTTANEITTVVVSRPLAGPTADYYNFSNITDGSVLLILYSKGLTKSFIDHGATGRGTGSIKFSLITGLNDQKEINNNISIFPNPTKDLVEIKLDKIAENTTISILSLNYQELKTESVANENHFTISTADLASGVYFIAVKNEHYSFMERIIKE